MAANELKKCSVRIGGVYYQLVTAEDESYTRRIAAHADEMINRVQQDNPQLSQAMATVLALVNAVDELARAYQQLKSMEGQHLDLDQKASEARRELNRLREQHWEMKKELLRVTELNRDYQSLINRLTQDEDRNKPDLSATPGQAGQTGAPDQATLPYAQDQPDDQATQPDTQDQPDEQDQPINQDQPDVQDQPDTSDDLREPANEREETGLAENDDSLTADPDSAHKTLDRLQQTNLDDYLRAFGLSGQAGDAKSVNR